MTRRSLKEIENELSSMDVPKPPTDLAERIKAEIPELAVVADVETPVSGHTPYWRRRSLIAASLFVTVVGGSIAYRVLQNPPPLVRAEYEVDSDRSMDAEKSLRSLGYVGGGSAGGRQTRPEPAVPSESDERSSQTEALGNIAGGREVSRHQKQRENKRQLVAKMEALRRELEGGSDATSSTAKSTAHEALEPVPEAIAPYKADLADDEQLLMDESTDLNMVSRRPTPEQIAAFKENGRAEPAQPQPEPMRSTLPKRKQPAAAPSGEIEDIITIAVESPLLDERKLTEPHEYGRERVEHQNSRIDAMEVDRARMEQEVAALSGKTVLTPAVPPSTGGTAEPNDQPYGDMFFKSYGTNPFIDTEDDAQSTFGLDVDTGSYTVARNYLNAGNLPPREAIRVEEFVNYFDYGDPAPSRDDFAIHVQAAPSPFADGPRYQLVRFNLRAREVDLSERKPATLIFVVDVSGSMDRENRLGLVKQSLRLLLDQLGQDDQVGLVIYGSRGEVVLEPTGNLANIERAIDRLQPGGSTNAEEGLVLAYKLADEYFRRDAINRVILCSDGVANVGRTGPESILARIERAAESGVELTSLGFGLGNYNDVLMEQLADKGDGSYAYVDTLDEARRVLVENLTGTLQTIAGDAKVQVEFNPEAVSRYRLLGYENRDIADDRFRDDTVDAGEIGAGHSVTALYEIKLQEDVPRGARLAELRLRYRSKETDKVREISRLVKRSELARRWSAAERELQLTAVVAEFAELLKGSYWAREGSLDDLLRRSQKVSARYAGDPEVAEFVSLVAKVRRLVPEPETSLDTDRFGER